MDKLIYFMGFWAKTGKRWKGPVVKWQASKYTLEQHDGRAGENWGTRLVSGRAPDNRMVFWLKVYGVLFQTVGHS